MDCVHTMEEPFLCFSNVIGLTALIKQLYIQCGISSYPFRRLSGWIAPLGDYKDKKMLDKCALDFRAPEQ